MNDLERRGVAKMNLKSPFVIQMGPYINHQNIHSILFSVHSLSLKQQWPTKQKGYPFSPQNFYPTCNHNHIFCAASQNYVAHAHSIGK
jgi:hypothetical protein